MAICRCSCCVYSLPHPLLKRFLQPPSTTCCVPQARFWKLRQGELEGYTQLYAPLKMRAGVLEDPMYFDFISFSQYATINA